MKPGQQSKDLLTPSPTPVLRRGLLTHLTDETSLLRRAKWRLEPATKSAPPPTHLLREQEAKHHLYWCSCSLALNAGGQASQGIWETQTCEIWAIMSSTCITSLQGIFSHVISYNHLHISQHLCTHAFGYWDNIVLNVFLFFPAAFSTVSQLDQNPYCQLIFEILKTRW